MTARILSSRILIYMGLVAMVIGVVDPLEGSFVILPGSGLVTLGAYIGRNRRRAQLFRSFILIAIGVGAMIVMSGFGGVGGKSGHSNWWLLTALPYPVGWVLSLAYLIPTLIEPSE
jgi:hypothetical protein